MGGCVTGGVFQYPHNATASNPAAEICGNCKNSYMFHNRAGLCFIDTTRCDTCKSDNMYQAAANQPNGGFRCGQCRALRPVFT